VFKQLLLIGRLHCSGCPWRFEIFQLWRRSSV